MRWGACGAASGAQKKPAGLGLGHRGPEGVGVVSFVCVFNRRHTNAIPARRDFQHLVNIFLTPLFFVH